MCGNPVVGTIICFLFLYSIYLLFKKHRYLVGIFIILPFIVSSTAAIVGIYPYGYSRHIIFLTLFAIAGISYLFRQLLRKKVIPIILAVIIVAPAWNYYAIAPPQQNSIKHQNVLLIHQLIDYLYHSVPPDKPLFVDYQTNVLLGYYLGKNQVTQDSENKGFLESSYHQIHVVSSHVWSFDVQSFTTEFERFKKAYSINKNTSLWIVQAGWGVNLYQQLQGLYPNAAIDGASFGDNIAVFQIPE